MGLREQNGKAWYAVAASAVLLAGAWSAPGLAATGSLVDCPGISGDITDIDRQPGALSFDVVDHIAVEDPSSINAPIDASPNTTQTPGAVVYLTPMVAAILHDVFGSDTADVDPTMGVSADADPNRAGGDDRGSPQVAPIAESVDGPESGESVENTPPGTLIEQSEDLRLFRQQMYRTDI